MRKGGITKDALRKGDITKNNKSFVQLSIVNCKLSIVNCKLLIVILLFFVSCGDNSEITTADIVRNVGPDEMIDAFTVVTLIGEEQEWLMEADHMMRFNAERRWVAYNVFMETLTEESTNFYRADSVFVSDVTNIMTGMGNVVVTSPRGTLNTDLLHWNRMNDQIHAPYDVYIIRDEHEFWGDDLHSNSNMDFINLRNVRGMGRVQLTIDN